MLAAIDERMPGEAKMRLESLGARLLELPPFPLLPEPVSCHPDMLLLPLDHKVYFYEKYYPIARAQIDAVGAAGWEPCPLSLEPGKQYPLDVALNCFPFGNALFGYKRPLLPFSKLTKRRYVGTAQGYAKCSAIVLENGIITSDPSIARTAEKENVDCLLVRAGNVILPGYETGFLGGCTGILEDTVLFCGDLARHPDGEKIRAFLAAKGYRALSLSPGPLYDVGSIFFF